MTEEDNAEILKRCPSLDEAVNKAAQYLPNGYLIKITVEKHGYGVDLVNYKKGLKMDIDGGGIIGCVNDAIAIANGIEP